MTSPSSWGREEACLASTVLPQSRSTGPGAVRGTVIHRYLCAYAQATNDEEREEALLEVDEDVRPMAAAIEWERMPTLDPSSGVAELAMAYSPSTGRVRELGRGGSIEHDDVPDLLQGDEIGGIADWVALTSDGVWVCDWKTGWSALVKADVNRQLGAYGLWVARFFGREKAVVSYARLFENGNVAWDIAMMDALRLDATEAALRKHLHDVDAARVAYRDTGAIPPPTEGGHCLFCPAFRFCPTKAALLISAIEQEPGKAAEIARLPQPLNHDIVSRMWPKLKAAEKLIEKLQKDMRDYVRLYGAVKLSNGNFLAEDAQPRSSIDPTFARPVLEEFFGAEGADMAIKSVEKCTWTSLDKVLRARSSHGTKAKLERKVEKALDDAGAIRTVVIHNVTEVTAKRLQAVNDNKQRALHAGEEPEAA
jgi:RecB family exonuclease